MRWEIQTPSPTTHHSSLFNTHSFFQLFQHSGGSHLELIFESVFLKFTFHNDNLTPSNSSSISPHFFSRWNQ
ncbi:hypothetical protein P8452_56305 [Trifolium repens]|nr:hypothetical protein P8452_56305 [Trifolium repens]